MVQLEGISWIQDPGSCIQDPVSRILDPGSWIQYAGSRILDHGSWITAPGSRILAPGSWMWIQDPGYRQDPGSRILDHGSWITDPGSRMLDPGSWILDHGPSPVTWKEVQKNAAQTICMAEVSTSSDLRPLHHDTFFNFPVSSGRFVFMSS